MTSLRLLRQKTTVSLLKAVSDSHKAKVKKYLYLLWILGKRASQGLSSLLQLVLKMLDLWKLLLNLHLRSHFWQDRICSNSQPGSSGSAVAFSKLRWLTAHPEAVSSCHVRAQGLQWWGGHKQTQGHTMAMHLPALPQAKTTPQASHSSLLIDPYCKQDQVTQMLNLNTTCGTTADNQTQEGFVRLINRKDSCTFQILHHSWQVTLRTCDYIW